MNYVNDSAPMHFASAVNAPTAAIYCSTVPSFGFGPLSTKAVVIEIQEPLACRPCGIHGHAACPEGHFNCALHIKDEQLLNALPESDVLLVQDGSIALRVLQKYPNRVTHCKVTIWWLGICNGVLAGTRHGIAFNKDCRKYSKFFLHKDVYLRKPMDINCSDKELFIFKKIAHAAEELKQPCYVIGGFVRDKILGRNSKDADIVCVGDGIELAHRVAERFQPKPPVAFYKNFGTASIKVDDFDIEFVGARKESYRYHSRNPEVAPGTLEEDQLRRDFTINALAINLSGANYGKLIDPFNGLDDLNAKIIRTPLEPGQTFSDDPLRMMRAVRFASQLGFTIDEKTWEGICLHVDRIKIISQEADNRRIQ